MFKITKGGTIKFTKGKTGTAQKHPAKETKGTAAVQKKANPSADSQKAMVPDAVSLVPAKQGRTPKKQGPY